MTQSSQQAVARFVLGAVLFGFSALVGAMGPLCVGGHPVHVVPCLSLSASPNPALATAPVQLSATFRKAVPDGTSVAFYDDLSGPSLIGSSNTVNRIAVLQYSFSAGLHHLSAAGGGFTASSLLLVESVAAAGFSVDVHSGTGSFSNLNGVFEPGETIQIEPEWRNVTGGSLALTGTASNLTGPAGATYSIDASFADYGMVAAGASANCYSATMNCYRMSVSNPAARPALHWDATFLETLSTGDTATHVLHIGHSFPDVPDTNILYRFVETLLHNEVTLGYADGTFRPSDSSIRGATMIFVARGTVASDGDNGLAASGSVGANPFNCIAGGTSLFVDVQPTDSWCKHVHALAAGGVNVSYQCVDPTHACPADNTSRAAMAVVVAGAVAGGDASVPASATYSDTGSPRSYACGAGGNSHFPDVAPTDAHCRHVNYLWAHGMIDGYADGKFRPDDMVTRGQMAKFITNAFALSLN
jgi:hypothetical protein